MGLTPLAGVPMGSRSGDIDPSIVTFLMEKEGLSAKEMDNILNKKSGKLGLSGISADDRDIEKEILNGNKRAELAIDNFIYQVVGYIGRFAAQMNGVDVITFAGGVGAEVTGAFRLYGCNNICRRSWRKRNRCKRKGLCLSGILRSQNKYRS